jgi:hypothetical protein
VCCEEGQNDVDQLNKVDDKFKFFGVLAKMESGLEDQLVQAHKVQCCLRIQPDTVPPLVRHNHEFSILIPLKLRCFIFTLVFVFDFG